MEETNIVNYQNKSEVTDADVRGWDGPGWYFLDEAAYLCGPYPSKEEASKMLKRYVEEYLE